MKKIIIISSLFLALATTSQTMDNEYHQNIRSIDDYFEYYCNPFKLAYKAYIVIHNHFTAQTVRNSFDLKSLEKKTE